MHVEKTEYKILFSFSPRFKKNPELIKGLSERGTGTCFANGTVNALCLWQIPNSSHVLERAGVWTASQHAHPGRFSNSPSGTAAGLTGMTESQGQRTCMTIQYKYLLKTHKNRSTFNPSQRHTQDGIWPVNGSC